MAAGAWQTYYAFRERIADGTIDLDNDTFKVALLDSGYTPDLGADAVWADISEHESSGNGYAPHTATATWSQSGGTATFDIDDPAFTASGGPIAARYAVIYDDTPTSPADPLVAYALLDTTPADVSVTDGNTLTLVINESGVFTLTQAA